MGPEQVLSLQVRMDLGEMAMKGFSIFFKVQEKEPLNQVV